MPGASFVFRSRSNSAGASEVTLTFTISIFVLGFAAFFGGLWLNRKGPRVIALIGDALYGLGVFLASFSHHLWWSYLWSNADRVGLASAFGPLLIAHMRETAGSYRGALHMIAGVMAISALLRSWCVRRGLATGPQPKQFRTRNEL